MKVTWATLCLLFWQVAAGQELYVFSDPASNVPARAVVLKGSAVAGLQQSPVAQRYTKEGMLGLSKSWMLRTGTTFSNMSRNRVGWEAAYLYGKYRFLSNDDVHAHFRMALFAEGGYSRNASFYDEINIQGDVSGVQTGVIATQLQNKTAVSLTASYLRAFRRTEHMVGPPPFRTNNALGYSLSAGQLILPKVYKSYNQTNLNLYLELLGQKALDSKAWFLDAAPAVQLILNSNTKLNFGYRWQLGGNAARFNRNQALLSVEHTFFNAL